MKRTRLFWILLSVLAAAYLAIGLSRISFNVDILRLFPQKLHVVEGLSLFLKNFSRPNELVITVESSDSGKNKEAADYLAKILRSHADLVKKSLSEPPWENNPSSLSEALSFLLLNQSPKETAELRQRLSPAQSNATLRETLEDLNTTFSAKDLALLGFDPYRLSLSLPNEAFASDNSSGFSSTDGTFRIILIEAAKPFSNYTESAKWLVQIKGLSRAATAGMDVKLGFTGEPAFISEISSGMQWDMVTSALTTLTLISLIFFLCYGKFRPLICLLLLLQLILLFSLATAGLFLNQLTAMGAGFASVMIGLSVDYGYFIYHQSLHHTGGVPSLQLKCLRNILWTSSTTATAFFALNLSSLPGLSQLGNMVGIGVVVGVLLMLVIFAPIVKRLNPPGCQPSPTKVASLFYSARFFRVGERVALVLVIILLGGLFMKGFPKTDFSPSTLRPKDSASQAAMENLYRNLHDNRGELSLIVSGTDTGQVLRRLKEVEAEMEKAKAKGEIKRYVSPLPLWPDENRQRDNLASLSPLKNDLPRLQRSLTEIGFNDSAFLLTSAVLQQLAAWKDQQLPIWPTNETSQWILQRMVHHDQGNFLAMGMVEPSPGNESKLVHDFQQEGGFLVSWDVLGAELGRTMPKEVVQVSAGLMAAIFIILAFALHRVRSVVLFAAITALVLACLAGAMSILGMTWGFFNLAAVLLLLGTGTDYSILLLLAMRRNGGDGAAAQRELGLVILLCCASAAAGFGSLAWASNLGLAALGKTCALGLLIDGVISFFLLPKACSLWGRHHNSPANVLTTVN